MVIIANTFSHMRSIQKQRLNTLAFTCSWLIPLIVYLWTLAPTVSFGGDCGDFITGSALMALVHPSGYPLHLLLAKLLTVVLPIGDISFRVNLLSALFGAAACAVAYGIVVSLTQSLLMALVTALSIGFSYVFWSQAVIAEVYTGSVFFTLLPLLLLIKLHRTGDRRYLYGLGLALGCGACHHFSTLMLAPALTVSILMLAVKMRLRIIDLLLACLFFTLPLALYAYIPLRANRAKIHHYWQDEQGFPHPGKSMSGFKFYITGQMYRTKMMAIPIRRLPERLSMWARVGFAQLWFIFAFALSGWVALLFLSLPSFISFAGGLLVQLLFYLRYDVPDIVYFYLPSWAIWACVGGLGAGCIYDIVTNMRLRYGEILLSIYAALFIGAGLSQIFVAYPIASMRGNRLAKEMSEDILKSLPRNAKLLVMSDDLLFAIWVVQKVEGKRMDVKVLSYPNDERWADLMAWSRVKGFIKDGLVHITFVSPSSRKWFLHPYGWVARLSYEPPAKVVGWMPPEVGFGSLLSTNYVRLIDLKMHRNRTHPEMMIALTCRWHVLDKELLKGARVVWLVRMKNTDISYPRVKDVGGNERPFWHAEAHPIMPKGFEADTGSVVAVDYCLPVEFDILPGNYELLAAVVHKNELLGFNLKDGAELKRYLWNRFRVVGECQILFR
ncbi:MAG: DUF2723 domain-containing protein [Armatimonadota bacterium]|nr:DUF2723 domain-containing protein [Armatimonadota bacterium]MCX7776567.1 DUF2723 domain-containing protein [Armatimonadota bacterium]MDW8026099.1 DUF2723 domain-containing protein [Armatimonadota bacterium]